MAIQKLLQHNCLVVNSLWQYIHPPECPIQAQWFQCLGQSWFWLGGIMRILSIILAFAGSVCIAGIKELNLNFFLNLYVSVIFVNKFQNPICEVRVNGY